MYKISGKLRKIWPVQGQAKGNQWAGTSGLVIYTQRDLKAVDYKSKYTNGVTQLCEARRCCLTMA